MDKFYGIIRIGFLFVCMVVGLILFNSTELFASSPAHFVTVWQGQNGQNHMNFMVTSASLQKVALGVNDEVAVFCGAKCVGAVNVTTTINSADKSTYLYFSASQDDGSGNGFTEGDTILFKIWVNKTQTEFVANSIVYRKDLASWSTTGHYSAGTTSVVEVSYDTSITQTIQLLKGNNLFSTYVSPANTDLMVVMKGLISSGMLVKIQDELGNAISYSSTTGWVNKIGSLQITEGYLINLNGPFQLQVSGQKIPLPLAIPLRTGWNYISFPSTVAVNAMTVIQPLIDQGKLVKVQDELGNSIENLKRYGGWKNNIGNFVPGKAYKVNVSSNTTLTIK